MFGGNFAPAGWMFCEGQLLPIAENETLFNLIGTTYGGDGQNTFALPDLRGRLPVHVGPGFALAQAAGTETVTLTTGQIPAHSHVPQAKSTQGSVSTPGGNVWALTGSNQFIPPPPSVTMAPQAMGSTGGSQPHDNMHPYLVVSFIISLFGVFPSQS